MSTNSTTYFQTFDLDPQFELDTSLLRERYFELQQKLQPSEGGSANNASSVRLGSQLNDAYNTLRDPVRRAIYLLSLRGYLYDADRQIQQAPEYLMQQLELREQLADLQAGDSQIEQQLDALRERAAEQLESCGSLYARHFAAADYDVAASAIGRMMFAQKLHRDINDREDQLLDL